MFYVGYVEITVMLLFITACAFFSFRNGFRNGVVAGIDSTLVMLESNNLIELEETESGDHFIHSTKKGRSKRL